MKVLNQPFSYASSHYLGDSKVQCLYTKHDKNGGYMLVCMHVDDLVIASSHKGMLDSFMSKAKFCLKITQSDIPQKTLGFRIERTRDREFASIKQPSFER